MISSKKYLEGERGKNGNHLMLWMHNTIYQTLANNTE